MRRNIDAWWPLVAERRGRGDRHERLRLRRDGQGVRPLAARTIRPTPTKAARIARPDPRPVASCCPSIAPALARQAARRSAARRRALAFHPPCTLQHGQQLRGGVETHLRALGFDVERRGQRSAPVLRLGRHLLGAAARAGRRAARPQARATSTRSQPETIVSANIGCIQHLQSGTRRRCGTGSRCSTTRSRPEPSTAMAPRYEEHAADPALAAHVHCTWLFEGDEDGVEQAVPPDGRCELIAHGGRPYEERGSDGAWHAQPPLLFAGQLTRPLRAALARRGRGPRRSLQAGRRLGVRRRAAVVVHRPPPRPRGPARPRRRGGAAPSSSRAASDARERLAVLSRYVAARIAAHDGAPRRRGRAPASSACWRARAGSRSPSSARSPASASASCSAASPRSSASRRARSPSSSACAASSRRCATRRWSSWSERAQAAGFFDHPQMARDFRRLLGSAPSQWSARGRGLAASLAGSRPPELSQSYKAPAAAAAYPRRTLLGEPPCGCASSLSCRCCVAAAAARAAPLPDLSWLAGDWRRCKDGEIVEERWLGPRGEPADRRQPDVVAERQGELREPAHRPQRRRAGPTGPSPMGRAAVPFRLVEGGAAARRVRQPGARLPGAHRLLARRRRAAGADRRHDRATSRRRSSGASRAAPPPTARKRR